MSTLHIGLVGDHDAAVPAHQAIPRALALAADAVGMTVAPLWVPTGEIVSTERIAGFDGLWCVPASPYRSMDGALLAIRFAREQGRPFLGTCGGFQHAVIEYARGVLGWSDAEHAETSPEAARLVISPLRCALVEATGRVRFVPGSRLAAAYQSLEAVEGYRCRYGLNPEFRAALAAGPLRVSAEDEAGEVRAVELDNHPFFVATLFQPERAALANRLPPLAATLWRQRRHVQGTPLDQLLELPSFDTFMDSSYPTAQEYASEQARHPAMTVVDICAEQAAITEAYKNQVLLDINEDCLRLAVFEGEYRWHQHPGSDELFLVVAGTLQIDFADGSQAMLSEWQSLVVPAGVVHRTRAIGRTVNLTCEKQGAQTVFVEALSVHSSAPDAL